MWLLTVYSQKKSTQLSETEFKKIFIDLYPVLCLHAFHFVGDTHTAKDIVHDVLERFWVENEKLTDKKLVKPYLYTAVRNRALNHNRNQKQISTLDSLLNNEKPERNLTEMHDAISEISFNNLQTDLNKAIEKLPEQRQRIFMMSRFQQMKAREIASELNISVKTVETQIYRSLVFLRQALKYYINDK